MDMSDIKNFSKVLCEIIMMKDRELYEEIRELKLSAIPNQNVLSENLMEIIKSKLIEWNINIQSFDIVTSKENSLDTMYYLIENIQSEAFNELEKLANIKDILSKEIRSVEKLYDCLECIPDLINELDNLINSYNIDMERRINIYKSLKDFASDLYNVLFTIKRKSSNFRGEMNAIDEIIGKYMQQLLNLSMVITNYPPRTIKKGTVSKAGTHFKTTINCLIESEKLFSKEHFQAYFLTEEDFKSFIRTKELKEDCKIKFALNSTKPNSWELKNMLWNPPDRLQKDRRKSERITNNKAIIVIKFQAFAHPYLLTQFSVEKYLFTDTVISIVHTNQEVEALITLFWDDYFRISRLDYLKEGLFKCFDSVTIQSFTDAVSKYFKKETARELTTSNKDFINKKLFQSVPNGLITLHIFGSQTMPNSSISFGNWIISIIKFLKIPGTCELWKKDLIEGFMRKEVESLFINCVAGTFSLRFSEKTAKIGVLLKTPNNSLEAWNPFSADECRNRNLCERLMEFHELQFIRNAFGNVLKKEDALSTYIPNKELDPGYTERGQLSRILCSNIYSESFDCFEGDDNILNEDLFMGNDFNDDITLESPTI